MLLNTNKLLIFILLAISFSCKKIDTERQIAISTLQPAISGTVVSAKGNIIDLGEGIAEYGFCWSLNSNPNIANAKVSGGSPQQTGEYQMHINSLSAGLTYYIRAYAIKDNVVVYGNEITFTHSSSGIQLLTQNPAIVNINTANISGSISHPGSLSILDFGHCWASNPNPAITDFHTSYGALAKDTIFISQMTNLQLSANYYIRTYCKLAGNTILYGNTSNLYLPELTVTTDTFAIVNATEIKLIGNIINLGIPAVIDHGFCWSTITSNPTINSNKLPLGTATQTGSYNANLTSLQSGISYYFRAYATDGNYVKYGVVKKY